MCYTCTLHVHVATKLKCMLLYRIYLSHLKSLDDAVRIVKESQSVDGAKLVAK